MEEVIDPAVITALDELSDDGSFFEEMLAVFLNDLGPALKGLCDAKEAGDVDTLYRGAHRLKSGSANIGAVRVHRACVIIEESARTGDFEGAAGQLDTLLQAAEEVRQWSTQHNLAPTGTC